MISQITGTVEHLAENTLTLGLGGVSYEIQIPTAVIKNFKDGIPKDSKLTLLTYHYHQTDQSKSIPILIGFSSRIEKDFFERFITVSGVGPKAAVRALSLPIAEIAHGIDAGDVALLKSLPGIGMQRAKEIVAKLQGKMGKFGLIQREEGAASELPSVLPDAQEEALEVLTQLQYKKEEARDMIRRAFARKSNLANAEEILNEVYRQKKASDQ